MIAFPTPRLARYAAAAALLISAFAGYQVWNQSPQSEVRVLTAETILPQPVVAPAVVRPEIEPQGLIAVEPEPVVQVSTTARFEFVAGSVAAEPAEQAIIAQLPTVQLERFETATADFAFELLPAVSRPAAAVPVRPVFTEEIEAPGVVGGLVRTALVEHYRDAARRSFRSADAPALDAEIARYVSEVFRGQNDLVAHAYELNQLLNGPAALDHSAKQVRSHVNGALESEAVIYGHLSEALPRRYWRSQGDADSTESSSDPRVESRELLRDVLGLERTLTTVLTGSQQTVDFEDARLSSGDLLRRIHERLGRIKELTRSSL